MEKCETQNEIITWIEDFFKIRHKKILEESLFNKNLLGKEFNLVARDLICLFFEIEKFFKITVPEQDIISGRFCNINNIIDIINEQQNLNNFEYSKESKFKISI